MSGGSVRGEIVVLSVDLMDRSKLTAGLHGASLVRSWPALVERCADADADVDTVIVDLGRIDDPAALSELAADGRRLIAYGSHVDDSMLAAASAAGAEALPRSVFFRRLADRTLLDP